VRPQARVRVEGGWLCMYRRGAAAAAAACARECVRGWTAYVKKKSVMLPMHGAGVWSGRGAAVLALLAWCAYPDHTHAKETKPSNVAQHAAFRGAPESLRPPPLSRECYRCPSRVRAAQLGVSPRPGFPAGRVCRPRTRVLRRGPSAQPSRRRFVRAPLAGALPLAELVRHLAHVFWPHLTDHPRSCVQHCDRGAC
jgi:hypothetical protein